MSVGNLRARVRGAGGLCTTEGLRVGSVELFPKLFKKKFCLLLFQFLDLFLKNRNKEKFSQTIKKFNFLIFLKMEVPKKKFCVAG